MRMSTGEKDNGFEGNNTIMSTEEKDNDFEGNNNYHG